MYRIAISKSFNLRQCTAQSSVVLRSKTLSVCSQSHQQQRHSSQGFWADVSASAPVTYMQESLTQLHDMSGLPWWSTIILSTVLLRGFITLPLAIYQNKVLAKVEKLKDEMPAIVKELKAETALAIQRFQWDENQAKAAFNRSIDKQWNNLIIRDNCHPYKASVLIIAQIPLWITQSWAIRNLIYVLPDPSSVKYQMVAAEMMLGGFAWIPNLTEIDHSWIFPITLGVLNLTIIEVRRKISIEKIEQ
jgi:mitochondrial inner membrane protein COX18